MRPVIRVGTFGTVLSVRANLFYNHISDLILATIPQPIQGRRTLISTVARPDLKFSPLVGSRHSPTPLIRISTKPSRATRGAVDRGSNGMPDFEGNGTMV